MRNVLYVTTIQYKYTSNILSTNTLQLLGNQM